MSSWTPRQQVNCCSPNFGVTLCMLVQPEVPEQLQVEPTSLDHFIYHCYCFYYYL